MDYKIKNLFDKIYTSFIRGEFGVPKIPNKNEVMSKIEEITDESYTPLTKNETLKDIDITYIRENFTKIIDDIQILFGSIEMESKDILDQLTNSLKEHNGVKRELRLIGNEAENISNGIIGEEFLQYNFIESFNDTNKINSLRSDPINFEAGVFSIRKDYSKVLSLNHYKGTKIEFSVVENYSTINESTYVGSTDAAVILDQQDPNQLMYKIVTSAPTRLRTAFALQLRPDSKEVDINSIVINVDSDIAKGFIRAYYKKSYKWEDIPSVSIQEIRTDNVVFDFKPVTTTHIKLEFIKDSPDILDSNTYYYIINNIAISKATTKRNATLYSLPISFDSYSNETPVIANIRVSGDLDLPRDCEAELFVTQDIRLSGAFLNSVGAKVYPGSPSVVEFDPSYSGSVYLSDIWAARDNISGIATYKGIDYNWKQLKFYGEKETIPEVVDFNNTSKNLKYENSIFSFNPVLFGDLDYSGIYTVSGWVNTTNPNWATLESFVNSGIFVSGIDVATALSIAWGDIEPSGIMNPLILADSRYSGQWIGYSSGVGYPFGYSGLTFGQYSSSTAGWWRPYSDAVTPTGIDAGYLSGNYMDSQYEVTTPDFYFNNIPFYKIYKFGSDSPVIDNSIRLFTYQERPINNENDYYPHAFTWSYKSKWIDKSSSLFDLSAANGDDYPNWSGYVIPMSEDILRINEEYIISSIEEIRIHGTNSTLEQGEYKTKYDSNNLIVGIDLNGLNNRSYFTPSGVSFDVKYQYRVKNDYLSSWTGYAIVQAGATNASLKITNIKVSGNANLNVINKIDVEDLSTGAITTYTDNEFNIIFDRNTTAGDNHYKITIYCASDSNTGFCANGWVPYEGNFDNSFNVSPYIKIVQRLNSIRMVDISDLIYDTPMNNDNRASIIIDNDEKYVVVKMPSKDIFPGFYFNSIQKKYELNPDVQIENVGHYIRKGALLQNNTISKITYTTGSSGVNVYTYDRASYDTTWNNSVTLKEFPNHTGIFYNHHSTYGYNINIDTSSIQQLNLQEGSVDPRAPWPSSIVGSATWDTWYADTYGDRAWEEYEGTKFVTVTSTNRGFLYYSTAENLPAYYSISYRTISDIDDTNTRFLYKIELSSNDTGVLVPKIRSLKFSINENL